MRGAFPSPKHPDQTRCRQDDDCKSCYKQWPSQRRNTRACRNSAGAGEIFGLLGPNGAGKTTTIKMLNTLASITGGRATVAGHDVAREPGEVRKSIGVVPQELTADDELSGEENMTLMAKLHQINGRSAKERIAILLRLVDLEDAAGRKVKTFSGGMRRRLQLVMCLIHEPKVLFLDEPTLGLDVQTRSKMWQYIRGLSRDRGWPCS